MPAVVFTVIFLCILPFNRKVAARRDFIGFWATGQQLVHHGNPYDADALAQIEMQAGFREPVPFTVRNPPWALPVVLPLGYAGPLAAAFLWSLAMLGFLILSTHMLWNIYGRDVGYLGWLGYCFPPALFGIVLGQTSILLLLGLSLFLRFYKNRPFVAGAALWLCAIKPHLFLPFVAVLLVWLAVTRSFRILAGAATAFAAGALVITWIDPSAWSQYIHFMRTSIVVREFLPCLGDVLRDSVRPSAEWVAFVPAVLGSIWALAWFWPRRRTWNWPEQAGLLMLVSLLAAPYAWVFDQALALPAILFAVSRSRSQAVLAVLALLYILVEIQIVSPLNLHSPAYLWIVPAWLAWYIYARTAGKTQRFAEPVFEA